MSIHRSLAVIGKLKRHRNVLKKSERLERLISDGKPEDKISIFELPKLRNIMLKIKPKPKKEEAAVEGAVPAEGAAVAAAAPVAPKGASAKGAAAVAPAAATGKPAAKADAKADKKK